MDCLMAASGSVSAWRRRGGSIAARQKSFSRCIGIVDKQYPCQKYNSGCQPLGDNVVRPLEAVKDFTLWPKAISPGLIARSSKSRLGTSKTGKARVLAHCNDV